jgi:hypothetical protein
MIPAPIPLLEKDTVDAAVGVVEFEVDKVETESYG